LGNLWPELPQRRNISKEAVRCWSIMKVAAFKNGLVRKMKVRVGRNWVWTPKARN
jgi:hypothetical protein